jgi:hypothetical protein
VAPTDREVVMPWSCASTEKAKVAWKECVGSLLDNSSGYLFTSTRNSITTIRWSHTKVEGPAPVIDSKAHPILNALRVLAGRGFSVKVFTGDGRLASVVAWTAFDPRVDQPRVEWSDYGKVVVDGHVTSDLFECFKATKS